MSRVYLTGSGPTKGYVTGSGIISNPARILLQARDSKTGSYPTIARTGDPDFTGVYRSFYDDTNTINFVGNSQTVYPTALPAISKWVSGGIATPNILQGLIAFGTSSKGIADVQVSFTPGQDISPFNESRIHIDNDSTFYQTGTSPSILPGFDQKLGSKTIVSLDTTPNFSTAIFWSTGALPHSSPYASSGLGLAAGINSGVSYFDWNNKQWQVIGNLTTGSNVDYINPDINVSSNSYLCISPSTSGAAGGEGGLPNDNAYGLPVSTFGFPQEQKFYPTGSQLLCLSGNLSGPFLLEKVSFEFSSSMSLPRFKKVMGLPVQPTITTFMLLRQSDAAITGTFQSEVEYIDRDPLSDTINTLQKTYTKKSYRELIWFGKVGMYSESEFADDASFQAEFPKIYESADLWIRSATNSVTGSFRIESTPKTLAKASKISPLIANRRVINGSLVGDDYVVGNAVGGSNFIDITNGRNFIRPIAGAEVSGSYTYTGGITSNSYFDLAFDSPYLLLPKDKILLVAANQIVPDEFGITERDLFSDYRLQILPGSSKLTLFGSLLRNNLPVSPETNQPLTSDAIHEDLHYDNSVFDQFDIEPYSSLSGSYVDLVITGSMLATPIGDPTAKGVRKVQGSAAAGQAGTTGSLQRFVNLISESDLYYDSLAPNPLEITLANGFTTWNAAPNFTIEQGIVGGGQDSRADQKWLRSFPFAPEYLNFKRSLTFSKPQLGQFGATDPVRGVAELTFEGGNFIRKVEFSPFVSYNNQTQASESSIYRQFHGIGDGLGGRPTLINLVDTTLGFGSNIIYAGNLVLRGFKYGLLNATLENSKSRFRRDRYGQFRDMLEQSPNAAYFVANSVEYPLEVKFFSRKGKDAKGSETTDPTQTHSQNLSSFATSSLPYFDGVARERPDNPDITVEPIELS